MKENHFNQSEIQGLIFSFFLLFTLFLLFNLIREEGSFAQAFPPLSGHPLYSSMNAKDLLPFLNTVRREVGKEPLSETDTTEMPKLGIAKAFYESISAKVIDERKIVNNESLFVALTVLTLEFVEILDASYGVIPQNSRRYKVKEPKSGVEIAKQNYGNLTRVWFAKSSYSNEEYPKGYFT